jgi:hypothetical protein
MHALQASLPWRDMLAAVCGFINYLKKPACHPAGGYEERKSTNREP